MRVDKGGVVDLSQSTHKVKKYEVKNLKNKRSPQTKNQKPRSMKDRLIASKLVQKWWRDVLGRYKSATDKIVNLQSIWRGFWVRTYLYEIVYFSILSQAFVDKFKPPVVFNARRRVMEQLCTLFGDKFKNRINFEKILKLQRKAKEFLKNMRDRKAKFGRKLERVFGEKRREVLDDLKDYALNNNQKLKKVEGFLDKVVRLMRIRIFHSLLFSIFEVPVNQLKSKLRSNLMKNHFNKLHKVALRQYLNLWKKNARPKENDNVKRHNLKALNNSVKRPIFTELMKNLKKLLPKGFKDKFVRSLLNRRGKLYDALVLKSYFTKWKDTTRKLAVKEFKDNIFNTFLFRTKKAMLKRKVGRLFRLWHIKSLGKVDLEKVNDFLEKIKKPILRCAFNIAKPEIEKCVKGIKDRVVKSLFTKTGKFKLITLRRYYNFWKSYLTHIRKMELQAQLLLKLKSKNKAVNYIKALAGRFLDWRRKASMLAYQDRLFNDDTDRKKNLATTNMVDALKKYGRKKAFKIVQPQLMKFLTAIIKSRALKKMAQLNPRLNKLLLRRYHNKWQDILSSLRQKEFRNRFFNKLLGNAGTKFRRNFLRTFFQKWFRNKALNPLLKIADGFKQLKNHCQRKTNKPLVNAFAKKIKDGNDLKLRALRKNGANKALDLRRKFFNGLYRNAFNKWRLKNLNFKNKDDRNYVWGKLFNANVRKILFRSLSNRFSFWRSNIKELKWDELEKRNKLLNEATRLIKLKNIKLNAPKFLNKLKDYKSNKYMQRFKDKLISYTDLACQFKLKRHFNRWRNVCKSMALYDMKKRLLKFMLGDKDINLKKFSLLIAMKTWMKNINLERVFRNNNKNLLINNGLEKIKKLVLNRKNFLFNRLKKLMRLDPRGRMLLILQQKLNRPRYTISRAFDKWRRKVDVQILREKEQNFVEKLLFGTCKKLNSRKKRDALKNRFTRWRDALKRPQDYYDKICKGIKLIDSYNSKKLGDPFTKIANSKNYQKIVDILLPATSKLKKRMDRDRLLKKWFQWKKHVIAEKNKEWACKILRSVKDNQLKSFKSHIMSRYFRKFAGYKPKSLKYPDVVKGELIIKRTILNRDWFHIKSQLKKHGDSKNKHNAINTLFGQSKSFLKKKLHRALIKWYRNMLKDDSNLKSKVLRSFKRIVLETYFTGPLENGFRRWLRKMIEKPKDIKNIVVGAEKLRECFRRKFGPEVFRKIKAYRSPLMLQKALLNKVMPATKFAKNRLLRARLLLWRDQMTKLNIRDLKAKTLNFMYGRNKVKTIGFFLKKYFNVWRSNGFKKKNDYSRTIQGEKIIFGTLARKYLVGFVNPDLKNYAYYKFLRNIFGGCSKYQIRALKPFYAKWRITVQKLRVITLKHTLWSKLVKKMTNEATKKNIEDVMRKKYQQWKKQAKDITEKLNNNVKNAIEAIKRDTFKKIFPLAKKLLKENALRSKKKEKLTDLEKTCAKIWNIILKRKLDLWNKNTRKLELKEFRIKLMQGEMRLMRNKFNISCLNRAFQKMKPPKEITLIQKNYSPLAVAMITMKRLLNRRPWSDFTKKTSMMNIKVPYGMKLSQVLMRHGKNTGKCFIIRNMSIRPYWKKWTNTVKDLEAKDLQEKLMKKVFFRNADKNHKTILRHYLKLWNEKKNQIELKEMRDRTVGQLYRNIYGHNVKILLRKFMKHWKNINTDHFDKLNKISLASTKLIHYYKKKYLNELYKRIIVKKDGVSKKEIAKKIWMNYIRKLEKGKLFLAFYLWKKKNYLFREMKLKYNILKNMVNRSDKDKNNEKFNSLKEKFLKWRIIANPKNLYEILENIKQGDRILMKNLRHRFNKEIFDLIRKKAIKHKVHESLLKFLSKFDETAKKDYLRIKLRLWKIRLNDKKLMKNKLNNLFNNFLDSTHGIDLLINKPLNKLLESAKKIKSTRNNSANILQKFFKSLFDEFRNQKTASKDTTLRSSFHKADKKKGKNVQSYMKLWKKNCGLGRTEDAGKLIQNFLRSGRSKRDDIATKLKKFTDNLTLLIKKVEFSKIKEVAKKERLKQLMLRLVKDIPTEVRNEFLKKFFHRWWKQQIKHKTFEAGFLVTTLSRGYLARKFIKKLLKQKLLVNNIIQKLFGKHLNQLKLYYNKWNLTARIMKMSQSATVIQNYLSSRISSVKKKAAKQDLKEKFRKSVKHTIADLLKKAGKINKNSAVVLYNTLKNIYYDRPFNTLKKEMQFIGKFKKLKQVYPMLMEKFRLYWVPYYLRMWKVKTWDDKINRLVRLQNWFRARLIIWKEKARLRTQSLMTKYLAKMTKDTKLLQKIYFKNWYNRAKNMGMAKAALNLQKMWQGNTSRKNVERDVAKIKARKLFKRLFIRKLNDQFTKLADLVEPLKSFLTNHKNPLENRYVTNNLLDLAKNAIRNNFMLKMTKRREFTDYLTSLRRYWDLWQKNLVKLGEKALAVQTNYRRHLAKKQLQKIIRLKDAIYKCLLKNETALLGKLRICFNSWKNKANFLNLEKNAKTIQNYVKKKNDRWRITKVIVFFDRFAKNITAKILLNVAKVNILKNTLQKISFKQFHKFLKDREKLKKLTMFFIRRLPAEDTKFRTVFLQRYLTEWRDRAKLLNKLRNKAALMIQTNYLRFLMLKYLANIRDKKARTLRLIDRLTNDNELRLKIFFNLWKGLIKSDKLKDSARVLNNFMGDMKNRSRKKKNKQRLDEIKDGLEHLNNAYSRAAQKEPFAMLKARAKEVQLSRFIKLLQNKRNDHLKTAIDKIKELSEEIRKTKNFHAAKLQRKWKQFVAKQGIWRFLNKIKKMKFMLGLMANRDLRHLNKSFKLWRKNAMGDIWINSAKTIQNFCDERVLRYVRKKDQEVQKKYRKLSSDLEKKRNNIPAIKLFKYFLKLAPAVEHLRTHIFGKLRYNINNYEKLKYMWKLFRIPKSCAEKMLRKSLKRWRDINDFLKKNRAANVILRSMKRHTKNKKEKKVVDILTKRLLGLAFKSSDLKRYFFSKWAGKVFASRMTDAAGKINNFISDNWERIKAKKKWKGLTDKLHNRNYLKDGLNLMDRYKKWRALTKLIGVLDINIKKDGFETLKEKSRNRDCLRLMKSICTDFNNRNKIILENHYWKVWRHKVAKYRERDRAVTKMMNSIDTRDKINAAKVIGDVMIVKRAKKLFDTIDKVKAMKNLKEKSKFVEKMKNLKHLLIKSDEELANDNKQNVLDNIFKIYTYKILQKLTDSIGNVQKKVIFPHFGHIFLNKLSDNVNNNSKYNYAEKAKFESKGKPKNLSFNSSTKSLKMKKIEDCHEPTDSKLLYVIPFFVDYLESLIKERKKWANDKIKQVYKGDKLCKSLKNFADKISEIDKKKFFNKTLDLSLYNKETPVLKEKLRNYLKKLAVGKIIHEGLIPASKFLRLVYLCRVTLMHNEITEKRYNREVVKRWKFIVHMQKLAKRKLESIYKNFHINYLATANDMFGDEENNAGVISEFSTLSEKMGMFQFESAESIESIKKVFVKSSASRKYNFGPIEIVNDDDISLENHEEILEGKTHKSIKSANNYEMLEGESEIRS